MPRLPSLASPAARISSSLKPARRRWEVSASQDFGAKPMPKWAFSPGGKPFSARKSRAICPASSPRAVAKKRSATSCISSRRWRLLACSRSGPLPSS
ncbi:Uncharacterised protein [Mycobacteroides abscessus subsp. abscessus]|nr:Uncharacterised protein [Mycobacteroides abscessus subsp. abscessus]